MLNYCLMGYREKIKIMKLLSIIIPIYNNEETIDRCIESIESQKKDNIEIIAIDDGSTDSSANKLDSLAKLYNNITVVHQQNMGVSAARNAGLSLAEGTWICFVDCDDFVEENYISSINSITSSKKDELIVIGYQEVNGADEVQHTYPKLKSEMSRETFLELIYDLDLYRGYLWNKLFLNEVIKRNSISFDPHIKLNEDMVFCVEYVAHMSGSVRIIKKVLYNYVYNDFSAVHSINRKAFFSRDIAFEKILRVAESNQIFAKFLKNTKKEFVDILLQNVYQADYLCNVYDRKHIRYTIQRIKSLRIIKKCSLKEKGKFVLLYLSIPTYILYRKIKLVRSLKK